MNKKWIILCAVIVVIVAVLLIWKPFGSGSAPKAADTETSAEASAQLTEEQPAAAQADLSEGKKPSEEETEAEEESGAIILEDGGDLEIIIPDDEDSAGF